MGKKSNNLLRQMICESGIRQLNKDARKVGEKAGRVMRALNDCRRARKRWGEI